MAGTVRSTHSWRRTDRSSFSLAVRMQCRAMRVQCVAVCCSVASCTTLHAATHYNTLQHRFECRRPRHRCGACSAFLRRRRIECRLPAGVCIYLYTHAAHVLLHIACVAPHLRCTCVATHLRCTCLATHPRAITHLRCTCVATHLWQQVTSERCHMCGSGAPAKGDMAPF